MTRIKDIKDIPVFLGNQRYDEFYKNMSKKRLKKEVSKRHILFERLQNVLNRIYILEDDFVQDKKKSKRLNKKNYKKKMITIEITGSFTVNGVKKILPPRPLKTRDEIIQEERDSIVKSIMSFTIPLWRDTPNGRLLNYQSSDFTIMPGFNFDSSPVIVPIMNQKYYQNLKKRDGFCDVSPRNLDEYLKMPNFYINLDFSDDVIIEELKNELRKLRENQKNKPLYSKSKTYIHKLKNFRILQVMDIILWQLATDQYIQYETFASFLYAKDQFSGKQLKETIIPIAKNLLDSKSNESGFFYYIVNKNDEK